VFLVRHAEAEPATIALGDPYRSLSVIGRTQARALGERMRWHDCEPTHVWTSPLVRAVQTAELVGAGLGCELPIVCVPALAPDGSPDAVHAAIGALADTAAVVIVGHEPTLATLGASLLGQRLAGLAKAEAVRIVDGALRWRFAWDADEPRR